MHLGNLAALMGSRAKEHKALLTTLTAIEMRLKDMRFLDAYYQLAINYLNAGYLFTTQGHFANADALLNKGLIILEELDKSVQNRTSTLMLLPCVMSNRRAARGFSPSLILSIAVTLRAC
jgi:hypothetical protein